MIGTQIVVATLLLSLFFLFFFKWSILVSKLIGRRVCPVCFSVGSTWLSLIILSDLNLFPINKHLIAILLAESVVGVSYLVEEFLLVYDLKLNEYLLKFGIILYGTVTVAMYAFVHEILGFLLFAPVVIFGFMALTPNKPFQKPKA